MKTFSGLLRRVLTAGLVLLGLPLGSVSAQQSRMPNTQGSDLLTSPTVPKPVPEGFESNLLSDGWGGLRARLLERGLSFNAIYTNEVFGNPLGGRRQGAVYDGLLDLGVDADFEKLVGLPGAKLHVNAYEIHGASGSAKYVRDFNVFSNIDFYDSFRLFELWFEQEVTFPRFGKLSLRLGQMASDKEFYGSEISALFVNSSFGVLPSISGNLPVPIFAIAAPGVRLRYDPGDAFYLQAAVYDGNPDPDTLGDPSPGFVPGTSYNHTGGRVNLNSKEGAFSIYEAGWRRNQGREAKGLPGTYKLGGWYHTDTFSDPRSDMRGRSLADPASDGVPRGHAGNYGAYLVIDQALYHPAKPEAAPDPKDRHKAAAAGASEPAEAAAPASVVGEKGLYGFLRVSAAPGDRNAVSFYADGGLSYKGLFPTRDDDMLGVGASYTRFGDSARGASRDANFFSGVGGPTLDEEMIIEVSYQAVLAPWWSVQPDLQVILHPGGSALYDDALVLGLRSILSF
jgi:porin